jgi:cell division protein FtsW
MVFIPGLGSNNNTGAHSWINIFGHSFQPAEFAKLGLIIFLSALLTKHGYAGLQDLKSGFLSVLGMGIIPIVLVILQPDIGTVAVLFSILFVMLFVSGAKWSHIFGLAGVGVAALLLMVIIAPYRLGRVTTFLHPELDPQGIGYQINQAFLAIGSGGFFGRGLGQSLQKFQYLPEVHADSIFAIIAEEMGLVFALGLVVLIVFTIGRSLILAKKAPDQFGRLLVVGIITWFGIQSVLNIGAMVGLLPLTGLPLPFVSHGGSALMIAMAATGIIINVSKQT